MPVKQCNIFLSCVLSIVCMLLDTRNRHYLPLNSTAYKASSCSKKVLLTSFHVAFNLWCFAGGLRITRTHLQRGIFLHVHRQTRKRRQSVPLPAKEGTRHETSIAPAIGLRSTNPRRSTKKEKAISGGIDRTHDRDVQHGDGITRRSISLRNTARSCLRAPATKQLT